MKDKSLYTTKLGAGLSLISETRTLLELWESGMSTPLLQKVALESGAFPNVTARRLKNIISECFAHRYLIDEGDPATDLKKLEATLSKDEFQQLLFLYTCRANPILADFIKQVYWERYASGYIELTTDDARDFVERALDEEKMETRWSDSVIKRVSSYLIGCCADYGMLENKRSSQRKILSFQIASKTVIYLAYKLHFSGLGDNSVIGHENWQLFGLAREDVLDEFKRLAVKDVFIVQSAGGAVNISWKYKNMEEVCDALAEI
ncbi:MAG: DUF1819 family protein [Aridibacter sp.]